MYRKKQVFFLTIISILLLFSLLAADSSSSSFHSVPEQKIDEDSLAEEECLIQQEIEKIPNHLLDLENNDKVDNESYVDNFLILE